ncbi:MAG: B12-binding domain-containing radical SAM protein [Candidatus Aenigmatarchaeota archaeon]
MLNKILFCIPQLVGNSDENPFSSIPREPDPSIGYLSEFLRRNGFKTDVIDLRLGYSVEDVLKKIERWRPDLIGIKILSLKYRSCYQLVEKIKSNFDCKVVIGGPHISTFGKRVLEECEADFAIKQEGEPTLLDLCEGKELENIPGLIYRNDDEVIENEDREFIDVDGLPFPRYKNFELEKYPDKICLDEPEIFLSSMPIISSRGCPYECIFCPNNVTMGKKFRPRNPRNVIYQIKYWYERGYRNFAFWDDNFTLEKERVHKICDLLERSNMEGIRLELPNGVRADKTGRELLQRMKNVGFEKIFFGVEAGNNKILKRIKKSEKIEVIEKAIKNACELGYYVGLTFMVGHPSENISDVKDSLKIAFKYPVDCVQFYNIIPFPGTELHKYLKERDYLVENWAEKLNSSGHYGCSPFFETPKISIKEREYLLRKLNGVSRKMRINYMNNGLKNNFGFLGGIAGYILNSKWIYEKISTTFENKKIREIFKVLLKVRR